MCSRTEDLSLGLQHGGRLLVLNEQGKRPVEVICKTCESTGTSGMEYDPIKWMCHISNKSKPILVSTLLPEVCTHSLLLKDYWSIGLVSACAKGSFHYIS
jgi:hypothetical protein